MASGGRRVVCGSFIGTNANKDILTPGFRPTKVVLFNRTTPGRLEWDDAMPDAGAVKTVSAGTITFITSGGITPLAGGFRVGNDAVHSNGGQMYFEATE
jgi:hypothetical protein